MTATVYYQCKLRRGTERRVGWIESRAAKAGARVQIKGETGGLWQVAEVFEPSLDVTWLADKRRRDRGALPSLVRA